MSMNLLGKVLFPKLAPWQRKKQTGIILWVILATVVFTAVVVAIMFFQNSHR